MNTAMPLHTRHLQMVPSTADEVRAQIARMSERERAELSPQWLEHLNGATTVDPWVLGFSLVLHDTGAVVGTCGFKGPPDRNGMVEVAYGIDSAHRNNGYATEAAAALVRFALASDKVRVVRAHTMDRTGPSARVLAKCDFRPLGQVVDPEDGLVWRWEIEK